MNTVKDLGHNEWNAAVADVVSERAAETNPVDQRAFLIEVFELPEVVDAWTRVDLARYQSEYVTSTRAILADMETDTLEGAKNLIESAEAMLVEILGDYDFPALKDMRKYTFECYDALYASYVN